MSPRRLPTASNSLPAAAASKTSNAPPAAAVSALVDRVRLEKDSDHVKQTYASVARTDGKAWKVYKLEWLGRTGAKTTPYRKAYKDFNMMLFTMFHLGIVNHSSMQSSLAEELRRLWVLIPGEELSINPAASV